MSSVCLLHVAYIRVSVLAKWQEWWRWRCVCKCASHATMRCWSRLSWWCSSCSGWLWLDAFARSTRCGPMTDRRFASRVRRLWSRSTAPEPCRQPSAHLPPSTRRRTAAVTSSRRRPRTRTTEGPACRVTGPTTAVQRSVRGRTWPSTRSHHATDRWQSTACSQLHVDKWAIIRTN